MSIVARFPVDLVRTCLKWKREGFADHLNSEFGRRCRGPAVRYRERDLSWFRCGEKPLVASAYVHAVKRFAVSSACYFAEDGSYIFPG